MSPTTRTEALVKSGSFVCILVNFYRQVIKKLRNFSITADLIHRINYSLHTLEKTNQDFMMISIRWQAVFIFIFGLIIFTIGLGSQEIIGFESRFYLFALEMWRHGPSWFPTTYQQPYPDYPATSTYLIYGFSKLVGSLNKFTAVFPSACAAAITLACTYLIGALYSRRWGGSAVLFLLFTVTFVVEARTISLDQFTTAITTLCFYLVCSAEVLKKPRRILWLFPLFLLGFVFRGPIGLVIPTGVICVFYLLEKDYRHFLLVGIGSALLLMVCGVVLLGLAKHAGGSHFMYDVLRMEVLGRMQDVRTPPVSFYFKESMGAYAVTYPLAILIFLSMFHQLNTEPKTRLLLKLFGWALVVLIGMSIPSDKKIRYILPFAPALALICGYLFVAAREQKYLAILQSMFFWFCFYFPLLCIMAVFLVQHRVPDLMITYRYVLGLLVVAQVAIFCLRRYPLSVFAVAVLVFLTCIVCVVEPVNLLLNHTRDFVVQVEKMRAGQHADLAFFHEGEDGLVIKYLVNMPEEKQPFFIKNTDELTQLKTPLFVISTEENAELIPRGFPLTVIAHGKIGRESVVVFSKNESHH